MESNSISLRKGVYFNYSVYIVWAVSNGLFLYCKLDYLKIPKLLVVTAYLTMIITFSIKTTLVYQHFTSDISKLTRFFLLTVFIQMPLVSFFLISISLLLSTPLEVCLHILLLFMTLLEGFISFYAVWKAVKHAATQCTPRASYPQYIPPIELHSVPRVYEAGQSRANRSARGIASLDVLD